MSIGIVSYGAYIPYNRLRRSEIVRALGQGTVRGMRSVASYDEDATSMGVEAARRALKVAKVPIESLYFATATPPYMDKANAAAMVPALGLPARVFAADMCASVRSGIAALRVAAEGKEPALVVLSDIRTGMPGGSDESEGGDGAAAFVFGEGSGVIAELLSRSAATEEFLGRWRIPGEQSSRLWEERFGEQVYLSLVEDAFIDATKSAGITTDQVHNVIVTGLHSRAVRRARSIIGGPPPADDLIQEVGNTGTAHPGILLAATLDEAEPDQVVALVVLSDGVDVLLFRTTNAISGYRGSIAVADQLSSYSDIMSYTTFLSWRGILHREPPRRPNPAGPAAPPALRNQAWKFGFEGSRCQGCGTRHMPPQRVCQHCGEVDQMAGERLADIKGTVATFTVDHLAYSLSPPIIVAVIDFDGGGRFECELTDVDPSSVSIGDRVEMTFRRLFTADGTHNYFWKARPLQEVK